MGTQHCLLNSSLWEDFLSPSVLPLRIVSVIRTGI
jgi:hypothetical protein